MVSRTFTKNMFPTRVAPHSVNSPGCVTGITVGSGAPGMLNVAKRNVSPASSEIIIWMKSWFELLKWRNGTYSVPVIWSTTGLEKVRQFCGCVGFGSLVGVKIVLAVQVAPPSVDRPKRSSHPPVFLKLVHVT